MIDTAKNADGESAMRKREHLSAGTPATNPRHLSGKQAAGLALALTLCHAAPGQSEENGKPGVFRFDIPAEDMAAALEAFSETTDMQLSYPSVLVKDVKSKALSGSYTADQALQKLLAGSNLAYRHAGNDVIALAAKGTDSTPEHPQSVQKTAAPTLQAITVTGTAEAEDDPTAYNITNASTATKTDTPIMETPVSVKVVPRQVLKDQQVITLDQALKNVSGAVSGIGGSGAFFLRGFGNFNVYRDGFLNQSQWFHTEDLANVERVEVLKGPGSILYGRTEPGGLVNFVTKQPLDTPYYSLSQQFGSFDLYRTNVDVTGPLTENKDLAYRFNLAYQTNNTFQEFGSDERIFVAPSLRWNISDNTISTLKVEYSNIKEKGRGMVPLLGDRPANIPRELNLGDPWNLQEDEYTMVSLNTEHAFNDAWKLRHRFNFSNHVLTMSGRLAPSGGGIVLPETGDVFRPFFAQNIDGDDYQHNFFNALELTGKFKTGFAGHTLLVGGDYYHADYRATSAGFTLATRDTTNLYNPIHQAGPPTILPAAVSTENFTLPWFGLYAQDQVELPYNFHLLAGVRYDNAETSGSRAGELSGPVTDTSYDRVSPRGGLVWQPLPELSVYGSYTENFGAANNFWTDKPLPPQTAQQWETGIKTELFDGRFSGTLAYFDLKKQNLPVQLDPLTTQAIGEAESRGVELDLTGEILPGWNIIGAYAYTPFAKTLKGSAEAGMDGKRLHNAPEHNGSLWTTYEFQQPLLHGLKLGAGAQAVSQREIGYTETAQAPGYVTANLMVSKLWKIGASRLITQLNVDNLLDKTYTASTQASGLSSYGAPRTFMGSIKIEY
jgi:iron complex outermembrane receptor protein